MGRVMVGNLLKPSSLLINWNFEALSKIVQLQVGRSKINNSIMVCRLILKTRVVVIVDNCL